MSEDSAHCIGRAAGNRYEVHKFESLKELEALPFVKAEIENVAEPYSIEELAEFEDTKLCMDLRPDWFLEEFRPPEGIRIVAVPPWVTRSSGPFVRLVILPTQLPGSGLFHLLFVERQAPDGGLQGYPIGTLSGPVEGIDITPVQEPEMPEELPEDPPTYTV